LGRRARSTASRRRTGRRLAGDVAGRAGSGCAARAALLNVHGLAGRSRMNKNNVVLALAAVILAATAFTLLPAATVATVATVAPKGYVIAEITVTDPEA